MASGNNILQKTQQAARDYVIAAGFAWLPSVNVQSGLSRGPADEDFDAAVQSTDLPSVVCRCSSAQMAHETNSGNWDATLDVTLRLHSQDTTEDDALARFDSVSDIFLNWRDAETGLSALDEYTALQVKILAQNYNISGRIWELTLTAVVTCCGSNIT